VILAVKFVRLGMVPLYFKWPHIMRSVFLIDATVRVLSALLPCDVDILAREVPANIVIDIAVGYCFDFKCQLLLI